MLTYQQKKFCSQNQGDIIPYITPPIVSINDSTGLDKLDDIKNLQKRGKRLSILFVGESQNDNPKIVNALQYCLQHGISVIAITRLKTKDNSIEISSSAIHKFSQNNIGR